MSPPGDRETPPARLLARAGRIALRPWQPQITGFAATAWAPFVVLSRMGGRNSPLDVSRFGAPYAASRRVDLTSILPARAGGFRASRSRNEPISSYELGMRRSRTVGRRGSIEEAKVESYATRHACATVPSQLAWMPPPTPAVAPAQDRGPRQRAVPTMSALPEHRRFPLIVPSFWEETLPQACSAG